MPAPDKHVPIGQALILRHEFARFESDAATTSASRLRAALLVAIIDELIERREKEAANGTT